ncbi:SRPBCC family protein [Lewinella sp. LCG006]|uniref:SRPBCC family protein n=1 Tax=Lewinella sp. LCG006 TaxID=3231911 RepID=UPI00345F3CFF
MKTISTSILIDAPIASVWAILMNQEAYPQWNPFIQQLKGDLASGNTIEAIIQPPGQKAMRFTPLVKVNQPEQEFRWLGHLFFPGIFDGEHYFLLEDIGGKQTKFIHGEQFRGLFAGLILRLIGESTKAGFVAMNEALKARAETLSSDQK